MADYQVMPELTPEEFDALKASIAEKGVMVPVVYDSEGQVLDGHHRLRAVAELRAEGVMVPDPSQTVLDDVSEERKRTYARELNLTRRHLSHAQKRWVVGEQMKDTPNLSDRQIASMLAVSPTTVGSVRRDLEERGELSKLDSRVGADGKVRPVAVGETIVPATTVRNLATWWFMFSLAFPPPKELEEEITANVISDAEVVDWHASIARLRTLEEEAASIPEVHALAKEALALQNRIAERRLREGRALGKFPSWAETVGAGELLASLLQETEAVPRQELSMAIEAIFDGTTFGPVSNERSAMAEGEARNLTEQIKDCVQEFRDLVSIKS